MKIHTTNYFDTLIEIAEDCPERRGIVPPIKADKPTIANYQFDMIANHPYHYTSDEVLFLTHAERNNIPAEDWEKERSIFFSKGQACLRASPLAKRYGWGIISNDEGKIALISADDEEYIKMVADEQVKKVKAMKSKR